MYANLLQWVFFMGHSRESNSDLVQRSGMVYSNTVKTWDALEEWKSWHSPLGFPGNYFISNDEKNLIIQRKLSKSGSWQMWCCLILTKVLLWSPCLASESLVMATGESWVLMYYSKSTDVSSWVWEGQFGLRFLLRIFIVPKSLLLIKKIISF